LNRLLGGYFVHVFVSKELSEGLHFFTNPVQEFTRGGTTLCEVLGVLASRLPWASGVPKELGQQKNNIAARNCSDIFV